jgi:hypothetical protein
MKFSNLLIPLILLLQPGKIFSQGSKSVEMADTLRQDGKIYVVVLGLVIILTGVIAFLIIVDRKLFKLEKSIGKGGV